MTAAEVDHKIAEHHEMWREISAGAIAHERQLHRAEIGKLREEINEGYTVLRALLKATDKLERSLGVGDQSAEIIDMPAILPRGQRHAG